MKTITTILMCALCVFSGLAQTDLDGERLDIPKRSPELKALYQQAKTLENSGTAAEINANRLAIKDAWQQVDPAVAALYKPIETVGVEPKIVEREISQQQSEPISRSPEDWDTDLLLREDFIDGLDMEVTSNGDIYISAYNNYIGDDAALYIYRSTDGGNSFTLWKEIEAIDVYFSKIQIITIDGDGEEYVLVYSLFENGILSIARWNMADGDFDFDALTADEVSDFSVDRNYPGSTAAQRVFATYQKSDNSTYSARSTAGSYGFDWVDETPLAIVGEQIAFAYGRNGGCYTTFIGAITGDLIAAANPAFNDPASWEANETVDTGSPDEFLEPTIRAARKSPANDQVIIGVSEFLSSYNNYGNKTVMRENGGLYNHVLVSIPGTDEDYLLIDSWVRKENDVDIFRTSYVHSMNSENNRNRSRTYNGDGSFGSGELVSGPDINIFDGFSSAIAETADGEPCMAYAGTNGSFGHNLYFNAKTTLAVNENSLEGFTFYPNPANDIINLSVKNTIENVSIYSLLGQEVMKFSSEQNNSTIDITSLATGIYVMKVEMDGQIGSYKIIKE